MYVVQNYRLFFGLYSKNIATFWEFEGCHLDCVSFIDSPIVNLGQDKSPLLRSRFLQIPISGDLIINT